MNNVILEGIAIRKVFGGLIALHNVDFAVQKGSITALIGPNGAGKTTLINVISGLLRPDAGCIKLYTTVISGLPSHDIARHGIARTFQTAQIFAHMSVLENVMVGMHVRTRSGFFSAALRLPHVIREEHHIARRAAACLETVGLSNCAHQLATSLPIGSQRLLEIARALAAEPRILLLDEPAAGLNTQETRALGELILRLKAQGITIVLVEHDMELVMDVADEIIVLDFGKKIACGPPLSVQTNPDVIRVYLGQET
ncbi:MAG: ABC transporter ATP-binding protein [Desulfobacterota bacterium]|nr:ABC transporter ATP-binding protein [Thermodesulfobacteriota bacterium]